MLTINPLRKFPKIQPGDDLALEIETALRMNGIQLVDGDILAVTQKIVSKAEDRYVDLATIQPTKDAFDLAILVGKDPRLVQVILNESNAIIRKRQGVLIAEHRLGFICANAGVDHSNIDRSDGKELVLCLPVNPDESARRLHRHLSRNGELQIGVIIIDSHGRAWRNGSVGITIGTYGVPMVVSKIGDTDFFGNELRATLIAAADQLAAAAALVMGEADEGTPIAHIRGFPFPLQKEAAFKDVLRPKEKDLFR